MSLLAIDDDELILDSLKFCVPAPWHLTTLKPDEFRADKIKSVDVALVDLHLYGIDREAYGVQVIAQIAQAQPHVEIIAMSGDLDRDLMEACLKAGASRFLAKPLNPDELALILEKIEAWILLEGARRRSPYASINWVGSGVRSTEIRRRIAELRGEIGPILIEGESGTGKEVVAQLLNQQELDRLMVSVNVAAIPEHLFESEFFGHVRGAFTGADQNKIGLIEAAHGGDLFLDEVEALSLNHQAKLLRFLETGEVRRVGAKDSMRMRVRVIAATNENLASLVSQGKFRDDLHWRLKGQRILTPPLRDRKEDIGELCEYFLGQDRARRKSMSEDALEVLKQYSWPGNVRELRRACEQLILSAPLPLIRAKDVMRVFPVPGGHDTSDFDIAEGLSFLIDRYESKIIRLALQKSSDVDEAARVLKISRSSLYKKIKDLGIDWRES